MRIFSHGAASVSAISADRLYHPPWESTPYGRGYFIALSIFRVVGDVDLLDSFQAWLDETLFSGRACVLAYIALTSSGPDTSVMLIYAF